MSRPERRRGRRAVARAASASSVALLLFECSPFGAATQQTGSTTSDAGASDASSIFDQDGGSEIDAGTDAASCFDLTRSDHGFDFSGNVQQTDAGVRIRIDSDAGPSSSSQIRRDFTTAQPISKSTIDFSVVLEQTDGSWGTNGENYVVVLAQYYGDGAEYTAPNTATTGLVYAKSGFDINVWSGDAGYTGFYGQQLDLPLGSHATVALSTTWAQPGTFSINAGASALKFNVVTATFRSSKYKLVIGGRRNGSTPSIAMTVSRVCVSLE